MFQKMHPFYLNLTFAEPEKGSWHGTVLTKFKNLTFPQELRYMREMIPFIQNGGYHFSAMGGTERISQKLNSCVESYERVVKTKGKILEKDYIEECISTGRSLWDPTSTERVKYSTCKLEDINLPFQCLKEFAEKYPYCIKR